MQVESLTEVLQKWGIKPADLGAERIYRHEALNAPIAATGGLGSPSPIRFRTDCILWGLSVSPDTGALSDYAGMELRMQFQGQEELITDGDAGQYIPFIQLSTPYAPRFELKPPRLCETGTDVSFLYLNLTAGARKAVTALYVIELAPGTAQRARG
jgi:hypothetical protein